MKGETMNVKRLVVMGLAVAAIFAVTVGSALAVVKDGGPGPDNLKGSPGADILRGNGGNDIVDGGLGNDILNGGAGNDTLKDPVGNDRLVGGTGNDQLQPGDGRDESYGGAGDDTILAGGDGDRDLVNCGPGTDVARVSSNDVVSSLQGDEELLASTIITTTLTNCETLFVDGIRIPTLPLN